MNTDCEELKKAVIASLHLKDEDITVEIINRNLDAYKVAHEAITDYQFSESEIRLIKRHVESGVQHLP